MIQASQKNNYIFDSFPKYIPENKRDVKKTSKEEKIAFLSGKKILFGSTIASTILTAGILGLVFARGPHGTNRLSEIRDALNKEIQEASQNQINHLPSKIKFYCKKTVKKVIDLLQGASNFTAIKDYESNKLFRKNKFTRKFADKATSFFNKVADKTLGKKYNKAEININDLSSMISQYGIKELKSLNEVEKAKIISIKGIKKPLSEWIKILEEQTQRMGNNFEENFSKGARKLRDNKRAALLKDLPEKIRNRFFKNKRSIINIENYKTYATEDLSRAAREEIKHDIINAKKEITNDIPSISDEIKKQAGKISDIIKPEDNNARKIMQNLKREIESYRICSGENEDMARNKIVDNINSILEGISSVIKSGVEYSAQDKLNTEKTINAIRSTITSTNGQSTKGALEEIMTILKGLKNEKIISEESLKEYKKLANKISKGIKKATELEAGEYFLKKAELKVGSAPTDLLSILLPIGGGAISISKADNKDEKVSAVLTTCIPLVGTFATFIYGTTKMLSGAKNLMFSLISGAILSAIGEYSNKLYKKYRKSGSIEAVVKNEYDKLWSGFEAQINKFDENSKDKKLSGKISRVRNAAK